MFLPETIPELFESELILFILMSDSLSYKERKKTCSYQILCRNFL